MTSAAAPSLIPLEFPAVTVPPSRNTGWSAASFSAFVSGRGCSSRVTSPTGTSSSSNRPASAASAQRRCDRRANSSCSSRVTAVALGDVLAGLAHRLQREHRLHPRIREAPAERRVEDLRFAAPGRRRPASPSRAARGSSTRRRPRRRDRRRRRRSRDSPTRRRTAPTRRAGSPSPRRPTREAPPAARPCAPRCGCPRRPGSRRRSRRPRSARPARRPARPPPRWPSPPGRRDARLRARLLYDPPGCARRRGRLRGSYASISGGGRRTSARAGRAVPCG